MRLRFDWPATARPDLVAGLSLAAMSVPQALGYTRIAGMPAVTGLYMALLPAVAFALLGASRQLVVSADSATAVLLASGLAAMAPRESAHYVALAGMVALLTAAMLLAARAFRLGFLADFLSRTVLVGFLAGVGVQVSITMLREMLQLTTQSRFSLMQLAELLQALPAADPRAAALAAAVVAALFAGRRFLSRWPVSLVVVIVAIAASAALDFADRGIEVLGAVPGGPPHLAWPAVSWREATALLPVAASCAIMIIAQSAATARSYALRHGESGDANADLLGLSAANAAAALSGGFTANGSPTQTAAADAAGARSQLAQLTLAGVTLLVLLFATGALQHLPVCVLGALVFSIALPMIDLKALAAIHTESPGEFALAVLTAAAVVGIGVEAGILLAITLSLLRHVRHSYQPHTGVLAHDPEGGWMSLPCAPGTVSEPGIVVYHFGADLFYANEQLFCSELHQLVRGATPPLRAVVVDASAIADLDYSAARALRELIDELGRLPVRLIFGRVSDGLRSDMQRHRIEAAVGAAHLHRSLHAALQDARAESTR
jgi:MFS superfamily sulfate permease-like transporter